jgi:hypothetical protein
MIGNLRAPLRVVGQAYAKDNGLQIDWERSQRNYVQVGSDHSDAAGI